MTPFEYYKPIWNSSVFDWTFTVEWPNGCTETQIHLTAEGRRGLTVDGDAWDMVCGYRVRCRWLRPWPEHVWAWVRGEA